MVDASSFGISGFLVLHLLLLCLTATTATASSSVMSKPVWNVLHGYNYTNYSADRDNFNLVTLAHIKEVVAEGSVNAVEIDILFHTDGFYIAHDYDHCNEDEGDPRNRRALFCLDPVPVLQEIEANPNITFVWIDPKSRDWWNPKDNDNNKGAADGGVKEDVRFSHLATFVRQFVKTKPIWWGLGDGGKLRNGRLEELVSVDPLGPLEGVSFDYGRSKEYSVTIQDMYLRARKVGIANIAYSNEPGYAFNPCEELNKGFAYRAEGKLSLLMSFKINGEPGETPVYSNEEHRLRAFYGLGGEVVNCSVGEFHDEAMLLGPVDGMINDMYDGIRTQRNVIEGDPTLRLANRSDVLWLPAGNTVVEDHKTDNVLANGGAEMPPLPGQLASSWRLGYTRANGALTLSQEDCPGITPHGGSRFFALPVRCDRDEVTMYQDIVLDAYSDEIRKGDVEVRVSASLYLHNQCVSAGPFCGAVGVQFIGDEEDVLRTDMFSSYTTNDEGTVESNTNTTITYGWKSLNSSAIDVPSGTRVARVFVKATRMVECDDVPSSDASSLARKSYLFIDEVFFSVWSEDDRHDNQSFFNVALLAVLICVGVVATAAAVVGVVRIFLMKMDGLEERKEATTMEERT